MTRPCNIPAQCFKLIVILQYGSNVHWRRSGRIVSAIIYIYIRVTDIHAGAGCGEVPIVYPFSFLVG
jgi:hypothetical protein